MINTVTFLEEEAYKLENNSFSVIVVPSEGANLISLYDKKRKVELLHTPKSKEEYLTRRMIYGTPILFPPNRIEDAMFTFKGERYNLELNRPKENNHAHGFVHDKKWSVSELNEKENTIVLSLVSTDYQSIIKQFPHHFILEMSFTLTKSGLVHKLKVKNNSEEEMPVGIGYHTSFYFDQERSKIKLELGKQWEMGERSLPTGHLTDSPLREKFMDGCTIHGLELDDEYLMTTNKLAEISHPHLGIKISYKAIKGFKHWVLFNANGTKDFLSVEPYTWVTNAPNLDLDPNLTGVQGVKPGETKELITEIIVDGN